MKGTSKNKFGKKEKNAKIKEGDCIFPFKYKWKTHNECFETEKGKICATEINEKSRTLTKYGYCKYDEQESPRQSKSKNHVQSLKKSSSLKFSSIKRRKKTKKHRKILVLEDEDTPSPRPNISSKKTSSKKTKYKKKVRKTKKIRKLILVEDENIKPSLKISQEVKEKMSMPEKIQQKKAYNEEFIEILGELKDIMQAQGEVFRARAYQTAQETIMLYDGDITSVDQLKGLKGIGETILTKLNEYVNTGTLKALEKGRKDPMIVLTKVYGIGPKKAKELIDKGIKTIDELRENVKENNKLLNDVQKIGLNYYEDILEKIPRAEIDEYKSLFEEIIKELNIQGLKFEIVGSYRRGKQTSGDIDVIITDTNTDMNGNNKHAYFDLFIDALIERGILIEILSRGKTKSLTISKLPGKNNSSIAIARRIDFLYTTRQEYPFAILYFTGSKAFNTVMRQRTLDRGYTLNEHGISLMKKGVKGEFVDKEFPDERAIFDFLDMEYKSPEERIDGRAVENKSIKTILHQEEIKNTKHDNEIIGVEETKEPEEKEEQPLEIPQITKKNITLKLKKLKSKIDVSQLLEQLKQEGISALKLLSELELSEMIKSANNAYYCLGNPIMTDNQYDILREYTLEMYPSNEIAKEGHTGCEMKIKKNKVTLPYQMWSMDKIKPDTDVLQRWVEKYPGDYVVSCKLDGVSGLYVTEGKKPKLYTRGNGMIGQDVSHLIPYLRLPQEKGLAIRGEFIISKEKFNTYFAGQFANPRNFVAGIINQTKINPDIISKLSFVAYELIKPERVPSEQLDYLKGLDIEVVKSKVLDHISNEILSDVLIKWRDDYEYEIDGIICTNDKYFPRLNKNPEHAFAFKMVLSGQVAEAKVIDVLWTPSKDGVLKPRVQIEPITLGGVTIEFATGFNAKFIVDNNIGLGAIVQLVRSGDVIPHILGVTVPADKPLMPNSSIDYVWNDTHVDIILSNIGENVIVKEKNIELFFIKLGVEGLKVGKVKKLVTAGYDTIPKILRMDIHDFEKIEGFGKKTSNQLVNQIREKIEEASIIRLMIATNFARGMGEKKIEPIFAAYPDILTSELSNDEKVKLLQNVKGIAKNSAERFVSNIKEFLDFLKETELENKLSKIEEGIEMKEKEKEKQILENHPLFGKKIVMTGFRDKILENKLIEIGAEMSTSVNKNIFVVLVKDLDETTGKAQKARDLGIELMTPDEFKSKYDLN